MSILISVEAEDKLQCVIGARLLDEFGEKYDLDWRLSNLDAVRIDRSNACFLQRDVVVMFY